MASNAIAAKDNEPVARILLEMAPEGCALLETRDGEGNTEPGQQVELGVREEGPPPPVP